MEVLGRLRSDRVMYFPAPSRLPGTSGRPLRHGAAFKLADPATWPAPVAATCTETARYGTARAAAWGLLHQQLASRAGWEDHDGELPLVEGTLIQLRVDHLPGDRSPGPLWLWSSRAVTSAAGVNHAWQAFLRRFDIEHMFRFFKQVLGWTRPKLPCQLRPCQLSAPWLSVWPGRRPGRAPGTRCLRHGNGWQGSAGSCTGACPPGRTRCLSCATRRCASRTGCICWRNCRWSQRISAAMAPCTTR